MRKMIVLLVVLSTSAMVFAGTRGRDHSSREDGHSYNSQRVERGDERRRGMDEFLKDATITTVSGTLELVNGEPAKLLSGKTTYTVMAPAEQLLDLNIKDGMKVTLEGAEQIAHLNWDGSEKRFIVTKITINNKTTTIDHNSRNGMMDHRGTKQRKNFSN